MEVRTLTPQVRQTLEAPILWDIMEEYVDEAEFALERFDVALVDPEYTLDELATGPEGKFHACIDGLVIAGAPVVNRLLIPALASASPSEPSRSVALMLALLAAGRRDLVHDCLADSCAPTRAAAARACALDLSTATDRWLRDELRSATSAGQRAAILEAVAARGLSLDTLSVHLGSSDAAEVAAAAKAARHADPRSHEGAVLALLPQSDPAVHDAALATALHYGSLRGWNALERRALDAAMPDAAAMEVHAALGGPDHHERLVEALELDSHRVAALRALGFSGNPAVVGRLLAHLEKGADALEAKLAAEAISSITGLDLYDDRFVLEPAHEEPENDGLPPLDDDLEDNLALLPEDALPLPNGEAIQQWCEDACAGLDARRRHLGGTPWSPSSIAGFLEHAPLRNRHTVGLSLSIRTGAKTHVDTRAFAARQRAQMRAIPALGRASFVRRFSQW